MCCFLLFFASEFCAKKIPRELSLVKDLVDVCVCARVFILCGKELFLVLGGVFL